MRNAKHSTAMRAGLYLQAGLTLMEMLVALVIMGVMMAGLAQLVASSTRNATTTGSLSRIEETGRNAIQLLSSDIRRAGYFGGNAGVLTTIATGAGRAEANGTCVANTTTWTATVGERIFGLNDTNAGYDCVTNADYLTGGGDILTVRYTPALPLDATDIAARPATRLLMRTTLVNGRIFPRSAAGDAANEVNHPSARVYDLTAHTYYVGDTARTCQGTAIPALFRKVNNDVGQPVSTELLAGVEQIQFRYKVGNQYFDAGATGLSTAAEWTLVEAVQMHILVRSECPESGFTNTRTFDMGGASDFDPPNDGFRREVFTNLTQLRNQ